MYIVIFGIDKPGMADVRNERLQAFRDYLAHHPDHPAVALHHSGPLLSDEGETMVGTHVVIEAPSLEAARAFVADSPFGQADLWAELHVRPWNWLAGKPG